MSSKVFVVQRQHKLNSETGQLIPKFNLTQAQEYGDLVFLLKPGAKPFSSKSVINELRAKLNEYTDDDYLLLVGNPALIGFTVAIAADVNDGRVKVLQWDGSRRTYIPISADLVF